MSSSQSEYLPIVRAVELATGRRPHLSTVLRWCIRGSRGIRLDSRVLGGRRLTTVDAVHRYMDAVTAASVGGIALPAESPAATRRRVDRAARELAERLR